MAPTGHYCWSFHRPVGCDVRVQLTCSDPEKGTGKPEESKTPHELGIVSLSSSQSGKQLLSCSIDGQIALWSWGEEALVLQKSCKLDQALVEGQPYGVQAWATALHPSGETFVAAGEGLDVVLFSAAPDSFGESIARFLVADKEPEVFALTVAFVRARTDPEPRRLASGRGYKSWVCASFRRRDAHSTRHHHRPCTTRACPLFQLAKFDLRRQFVRRF